MQLVHDFDEILLLCDFDAISSLVVKALLLLVEGKWTVKKHKIAFKIASK